jgi:type I site-specific restriction endonuclease
MPYSTKIIKLLDKVEPTLREVLIALLEEMERQRLENVTKNEFNELKEIVKELAEAQKRSEERLTRLENVVAELAEAQKRSEERLTRLENVVAELAEAQKRTEERLNELAEAQKRSEERLTRLENVVAELAEAQKRTEERLNELAEAQKRTERELEKLVGEHRKTREMVGNLQHTVGYVLEDRAFVGLPPLLKEDFGIEIVEALRRDYIEVYPGKYIEVNIIGKGKRDGRDVWIVGDCKTQLKKRDVDEFLKILKQIEESISGDKLPIIVTYQTSPLVRNYIKERGLKLYFSYQFPL